MGVRYVEIRCVLMVGGVFVGECVCVFGGVGVNVGVAAVGLRYVRVVVFKFGV